MGDPDLIILSPCVRLFKAQALQQLLFCLPCSALALYVRSPASVAWERLWGTGKTRAAGGYPVRAMRILPFAGGTIWKPEPALTYS